MEILLSLILGAVIGAGGLLYWQRRKAKQPNATTQGAGGTGPRQ